METEKGSPALTRLPVQAASKAVALVALRQLVLKNKFII